MIPEMMLNRGGEMATCSSLQERLGTTSSGSVPATSSKTNASSEIFSGRLTLVGPGPACGLRVAVKVHRTTSEHFAVVFPDKVHVCKPVGFVNLKNCRVELGSGTDAVQQRTLQIVQKSCDGDKLTLRADSLLDAKRCAEAMRSKQLVQHSTCRAGAVSASPALSRFREDCATITSQLPNIVEEGDEE